MKRSHQIVSISTFIVVVIVTVLMSTANTAQQPADNTKITVAKPNLSVKVITPQLALLPINITANGNITAWQEANIGNETDGLRLSEVLVNVGDTVQRGQLLASFASHTVNAELLQSQAAVAEADALLAEALLNVKRATVLQATGALPAQQIQQYITAEKTAKARLKSAQANAEIQHLRLKQTQVLAPDNGIISARSATVGAVLPVGQELFRLIRGGRLEWRAEVSAESLAKLKPGQLIYVTPVGGKTLQGSLRMVAPMVDTQTRNGLVYVDLPVDDTARAGTFARGRFELGTTEVITLPHSAVLQRDGHSYVMCVGPDSRIIQTKIGTGQRTATHVEITRGLGLTDSVVATGGGFLGEGDLVQIIENQIPAKHSSSVSGSGTQPYVVM
ncbi:efflux RND transporter periplasmic adaptor subunit [Pectobacterium versatile]|uniref:efflux RND transporter periplasmic adaptor subunit n=1 Tax=Pectobacterium versatile TaxID=2488639 RepID=UPI001C5CE81F|nr:efflux RND transporter periplasmic adaptor subunit [Pectobacterium versatile]